MAQDREVVVSIECGLSDGLCSCGRCVHCGHLSILSHTKFWAAVAQVRLVVVREVQQFGNICCDSNSSTEYLCILPLANTAQQYWSQLGQF